MGKQMKWFRFCIAVLALCLCVHGFGNVFAANGAHRKTEIVKRDVRKLPDSELGIEELRQKYSLDWYLRFWMKEGKSLTAEKAIVNFSSDQIKSILVHREPKNLPKPVDDTDDTPAAIARAVDGTRWFIIDRLKKNPNDAELSFVMPFILSRQFLFNVGLTCEEFAIVPETLPFYRELILTKVKRSGSFLQCLSPKYRDDDEVVREAGSVYYASDRIKDDEATVLFCLRKRINEKLGDKYFSEKKSPRVAKYEMILRDLGDASPRLQAKYKKMSQDEVLKIFESKGMGQ